MLKGIYCSVISIPLTFAGKILQPGQTTREFLTQSFKLGATQCVDFPTRGDRLYLVLTSTSDLIKGIHEEPHFCNSDHVSILFQLNMYNRKSQECIRKPAFRKADYNLINAFLGTIDWNEVYSNCHTMNDYRVAFKGILNTVIYNVVPFVQCSKQNCAPWFNSYLKHLRSIKQRRWKKYTKTRNIY